MGAALWSSVIPIAGAMISLGVAVTMAIKKQIDGLAPLIAYISAQALYTIFCIVAGRIWGFDTNTYGNVWLGGLLIVTGVSLYMVYGFWRLALQRYPGLQRLCIYLAVAGILITFVILFWSMQSGPGTSGSAALYNGLLWLMLLRRSFTFVESALLMLLFSVVFFFQIHLNRTIRTLTLTLFFFTLFRVSLDSALYAHSAQVLQNLVPKVRAIVYTLVMVTFGVITVMRREEATAPIVRFNANPEQLNRHLDNLNETMERLLW